MKEIEKHLLKELERLKKIYKNRFDDIKHMVNTQEERESALFEHTMISHLVELEETKTRIREIENILSYMEIIG